MHQYNAFLRTLESLAKGTTIQFAVIAFVAFASPLDASSGTEGASFLDIPVGAGPAALGAAYSALANDAYASTLNPSGLGFIDSTQFAGQHLAYLESIHYEHLSFGIPLPRAATCNTPDACAGSGLGASIQYLGSGDITGTDAAGNSIGNFSSHYAAYNLSYGHSFNEKLALGVTGKWINAKIDDVSANAYATDLGSMYRWSDKFTLAMVLANLGTKLTFLNQGDSLPLAFHLGGAYEVTRQLKCVSEIVYPKTGLVSGHMGAEWRPIEMIALRTGYKTDTTKDLSALAGFTVGLGLNVWGQEFSYAWLPLGDLGDTHYFSLVLRFGEKERAKRNLIQYQNIKTHNSVKSDDKNQAAPEYQELMELLNSSETHTTQTVLEDYNKN